MIDFGTIVRWVKRLPLPVPPDPIPTSSPAMLAPDPRPMKEGIIPDLFAGPGNIAWDLGRILGAIVIFAAVFVVVYGVTQLKKDPDLAGLALVVGSVGIWIGLKDFANRKPDVTVQGDIKTAEVAGDLNVAGSDKSGGDKDK